MKTSYAPVISISQRVAPSKGRRLKRFLLYGALLLVLFSPLPAAAQNLNASMGAQRMYAEGFPYHFRYWVWNADPTPIAIVSLNLTFAPGGYDWFLSPNGWEPYLPGNGSTLTWVAGPGYEIRQGQVVWDFIVWGQSPDDTSIDYQLVGIWPGTEDGDAALGKIQGHSY